MTTRDDQGRSIDQAQDALHQAMRGGDVSHLRELLYEGLAFELPGESVMGRAADLDAHASVQHDSTSCRSSIGQLLNMMVMAGHRRSWTSSYLMEATASRLA